MKWNSLKTKITVLASLLVATVLVLAALLAAGYFEAQFRLTIDRHQSTLASAIAQEIDARVRAARLTMEAVARGMEPAMLADAAAAERFLREQEAALLTFDNGLFLLSGDGRLLAGTGVEPHMAGRDYSHRDYFRIAAGSGLPHLSKPFVSSQGHGRPIIMFAQPLLDAQGQTVAVLAGSLDLHGTNFLGRLSGIRIGEGGHLYLFDWDRTILAHPESGRILRAVPVGLNPLFDRAAGGFEGSGETIGFAGEPVFSSFKRLRNIDWVLAVDYPLAEAFAPLRQARNYFLIGLAAILVGSVLLVWLFMRHLTAPLLRMTAHVRDIVEQQTELRPIEIGTRDEIGVLAGAFNRLAAESAQQKRAIQEQRAFAVNLLENAAVPIFVLDANHRVLIWNRACAELTGVAAAEVLGTDRHWRGFYAEPRPCLADFALDGDPAQLPAHYPIQDRSRLVAHGLCAEGWRDLPQGARRYLIFSAAPVRNDAGTVVAAIETLEDITARKESEGRMEHLAHFDPLTGLPNRLLFFDRLDHGLAEAKRHGQGLALLFLDLDGFKAVNDTLGHDAGDRVLVEVAERLKNCIRACDTVARMGGDEFTIMLCRIADAEEARPPLARIQRAFATPFVLQGQSFAVGVSIGVSFYPAHGQTVDILVKEADTAMYLAKGAGDNRHRFAEPAAGSPGGG